MGGLEHPQTETYQQCHRALNATPDRGHSSYIRPDGLIQGNRVTNINPKDLRIAPCLTQFIE
jgi:hypothetical protein